MPNSEILSNEPMARYFEYLADFQRMTNDELIAAFNKQVGNPGFVGARMDYLAALHETFTQRGFDYSAIGNSKQMSWANHIELEGNTVITSP